MDDCHVELIRAIVRCAKPKAILELGFGSGKLTRELVAAVEENCCGRITVVDNWFDWGGIKPMHADLHGVNFETSEESRFVRENSRNWDFVVADAEHENVENRIEHYMKLVLPGGWLIVHDYSSDPRGWTFAQSSAEHERCERGLWCYQREY